MTRKQLIITLIILLLIATAVISFFWGNPITRYKMKNQLNDYVQERYGANYYMSDFSIDIMHRTYHAYFTSTTNEDFTFYVGQNNITKEINDGYDYELERLE